MCPSCQLHILPQSYRHKISKCHKNSRSPGGCRRAAVLPAAAGRAGARPPAPPATVPGRCCSRTDSAKAASSGQNCPAAPAPYCTVPGLPAPTAAGPARPRARSGHSTPPCGPAAAPPALNKYGCTGSIPCLSSFVALLSAALTSFLPFTIMKSTGRCCRRLTVPPKFFHPIFDRFRAENASEVHPCIR